MSYSSHTRFIPIFKTELILLLVYKSYRQDMLYFKKDFMTSLQNLNKTTVFLLTRVLSSRSAIRTHHLPLPPSFFYLNSTNSSMMWQRWRWSTWIHWCNEMMSPNHSSLKIFIMSLISYLW